jgi:uncharacterized membrane protein
VFGRRVRLCARCSGIYPGIVAGLAAFLLGPARLSGLAVVVALPLAALVDWTATAVTPRRGANWVRTATGAALGYGYGAGLGRLFLAGDRRVLAVGMAYGAAAAVLLAVHRRAGGRGPTSTDRLGVCSEVDLYASQGDPDVPIDANDRSDFGDDADTGADIDSGGDVDAGGADAGGVERNASTDTGGATDTGRGAAHRPGADEQYCSSCDEIIKQAAERCLGCGVRNDAAGQSSGRTAGTAGGRPGTGGTGLASTEPTVSANWWYVWRCVPGSGWSCSRRRRSRSPARWRRYSGSSSSWRGSASR